jgi:hypothetical protein
VANIRNSKNESNSQPKNGRKEESHRCGKYQKFKERKQFTTVSYLMSADTWLWQISEIQRTKAIHNLSDWSARFPALWQISEIQRTKAIHNTFAQGAHRVFVVANIRNSKNESNSQLKNVCSIFFLVVANIRNSKNESNSQLKNVCSIFFLGCGKYQKFKERKQFTTVLLVQDIDELLWQISEIQRTKAIHNHLQVQN